VVKFGEETDTMDPTGEVTARWDTLPEPDAIYEAAGRFLGEIEQVPPMYSALRHQGERLYKIARRGETVAVKPRLVKIYRLEVEEVALPRATMVVTCSQGTYIRTLAADLGRALGCGAHLAALRRLAVGPFRVEEALPLEALAAMTREELAARVIPLAACLPGFKALEVGPEDAVLIQHGRAIPCPQSNFIPGERVRLLRGKELLAVALVKGEAEKPVLAPARVFPLKSRQ
jgi:tRNA pseudouridine55 synthase